MAHWCAGMGHCKHISITVKTWLLVFSYAQVTDFTPPECNIFNIINNCSTDSRNGAWFATVNITDGNGTGVEHVWFQEGFIQYSYTNESNHGGITVIQDFCQISCTTPDLKVSATDKEGNVGICFHSIRPPTTSLPLTTPSGAPPSVSLVTLLWICLLMSATVILRDVLTL